MYTVSRIAAIGLLAAGFAWMPRLAGQQSDDWIFTAASDKSNLPETDERQSHGDAVCQQTFAKPN